MGLRNAIKANQQFINLHINQDMPEDEIKLRAVVLDAQDNVWVSHYVDTVNQLSINTTLKVYMLAIAVFEVDGEPVHKFVDLNLKKEFNLDDDNPLSDNPYAWPQVVREGMAERFAQILFDLPQPYIDALYMLYNDEFERVTKSSSAIRILEGLIAQARQEAGEETLPTDEVNNEGTSVSSGKSTSPATPN